MESIVAKVVDRPISENEILSFLADSSFGAEACFFGVVRNNNDGKSVEGVTYDAFIPLAERALHDICVEAVSLADGEIKVIVIHRVGHLTVGEKSVAIGVGAPHRDEAFRVCRYVLEELKKRAPVWKEEHYQSGQSEWLKGNSLSADDQ